MHKTNKVISEVLFNRGLIWIVMAYIGSRHEDTREAVLFMFFAMAVYNFYKSWKVWNEEEE